MEPAILHEATANGPWGCSCGGTEASCGGQVVRCGSCRVRHHEACAFDLLKGDCFVAKFALLRPASFRCLVCEPERYSWLFQCSCIKAGKAIVVDFDDGSDMVECVKCLRWSHMTCGFTRHSSAASTEEAAAPVCLACTSEWTTGLEWFAHSTEAVGDGSMQSTTPFLSAQSRVAALRR